MTNRTAYRLACWICDNHCKDYNYYVKQCEYRECQPCTPSDWIAICAAVSKDYFSVNVKKLEITFPGLSSSIIIGFDGV